MVRYHLMIKFKSSTDNITSIQTWWFCIRCHPFGINLTFLGPFIEISSHTWRWLSRDHRGSDKSSFDR